MDRLLCTTMLTSVAVLAAATALANPQGGTVVGGQATIAQEPGLTTINQASHKAILNWQSFSIDKGETTRFNQPSRSAIALNRVTGNDPSRLMGKLEANGNVWLINPNGILAGPSAQINVHSFLGTTADIPNSNFLAGRYDFSIPSPNPDASVINEGTISIGATGLAGLVAPHVRNDGVIAARLGNVILAGASTFTVDFQGDGLIQFAATSKTTAGGGVQQAAVQNAGRIEAEGGTVLITASAAAGIVDNAINMDGLIEAQTIAMHDGAIVLDGGESGAVEVAGTLDASGSDAGETGGTVKVLGETVELSGTTNVNASGDAGGGEVLIGGNYQGKGPEANAKQTYVAEGAMLNADAQIDGDGGRVIVWADQTNVFAGSITARGGSDGGDGGFVEVSGKENLAYAGEIDVGADVGSAGSILFDPRNIIIIEEDSSEGFLSNNEVSSDAFVAFDDGEGEFNTFRNFVIEDTTIESLSGTVRLQARENITINADLALSQTQGQSFVLQAGNNITLNGVIITKGGNVHLEADSPHSTFAPQNGFGSLSINQSITLNGGSLTLIHSEGVTVAAALDTGGGTISRAAALNNSDLQIVNLGIFDNVTGAGPLIIGQARTAGPLGTGRGGESRTDGSITINNAVLVNDAFTGPLSLKANNGITANNSFATSNALSIDADADNNDTGTIQTQNSAFLSAPDLSLSAGSGINVNTSDVSNLAAETQTGGIAITNSGGNALTVATVDGLVGLSAQAGDIHLVNDTGGIALDAIVDADQGKVTLFSGGTLNIGSPVSAGATGTAILIDTQQFNSPLVTPLVTPSGRYLVYSGDVESDTNDIPAQQFSRRYGVTFDPQDPEGTGLALPIPTQGNFFVYQDSPTLVISGSAFLNDERVDKITYGEAVSLGLVVDEEGLIEGDSLEDAISDTGELRLDPDADPARAPAGEYEIVLGEEGLTSPIGYTLVFEPGSLLVNQAPLTLTDITPATASREYGDANPEFSATFDGLKLDDDNTVPGPIFAGLPGERAPVTVDPYRIEFTDISNQNYVVASQPGDNAVAQLTITPAPVTVTNIAPDPSSRRFGHPNPEYAATIDPQDLKFADDTVGEAIFDAPGSESALGTYTVSVSEFTNPNYAPTLPPDSDTAQLTITEEPSPDDFNALNDPATDNLNAEFTAALQGDIGLLIEDSIVEAAPVIPPSQRFEGPWGRRGRTAGLITPANQGRPEIW